MIIFEGCNGVGKTTYAKELGRILEAPVYRAFRGDQALHYQGELENARSLGVPVNTFVDDMYVADLSRVLRNEVILDRSLPSAVAYNGMVSPIWAARLEEWDSRLFKSATPVLVVWLEAPWSVAKDRMGAYRPDSAEYDHLERVFSWCMSKINSRIFHIDTSTVGVKAGVRSVLDERESLAWHRGNAGVVAR